MRHRPRHTRQPEPELGDGHEHVQLRPEGRRRKAGAFNERAQLGPGKVGVDPAAEAAIRASNDVFAADDRNRKASRPMYSFLIDGHDGIPASFPVLTTDYFEFGTDSNGLQNDGIAVEMDDAVLGLVTSTLPHPPRWASIRNYSEPAINGAIAERAQEDCASHIYMRYGYWTSVLGAIATWSIIAGL